MRLRNILFAFILFIITFSPLVFAKSGLALRGKVKGFGMDTRAGRGGRVIKVTNLDANPNTPGSLGYAMKSSGSRIVVFEVAGVIDLNKTELKIDQPFITIAGQTAPSPGITIIRGGIDIATHDVLIQHIRVRPGDAGMAKKSGWEVDAIATAGADAYNIVIDHCSTTWSTDENLSASGERLKGPEKTSRKVTFSNCIIAECLDDSSHAKGRHSKGSLIHDFCSEIAIIGNLYAHNVDRNPYFKAHTTGVIVNNLIYNPGRKAIKVSYPQSEWKDSPLEPINCKVAIVSNVLIKGTDSNTDVAMIADKGDVFIASNIALNLNGTPVPMTSKNVKILTKKPVWPKGLTPLPAEKVIDYVTNNAGARPSDRDEIDKRIINDFLQRKGKIIDSQDQVGGYPKHQMVTRKLMVPKSNITDWLNKMAEELE